MNDVVIVAIVGVFGTVMTAAVGLIGNCVLEKQRAKDERKAHIASARFNREFDMYQRLCEKHLTMVYDVGNAVLITRGAAIQSAAESIEEVIELSLTHIDEADEENKRCAPFISKEIFENYKELRIKVYAAISMFDLWQKFDSEGCEKMRYNGKVYSKEEAKSELEKRQKEVSAYSDMILEKMRKYLEKRENQ